MAGKVINWFLHSKYPHLSVSFDSSLSKIYSYNKNGFSIESLKSIKKNNGIIKVLAVFVTTEQYIKLEEKINWYRKHKSQTNYALRLLPAIYFNKNLFDTTSMDNVCSTFVNNLFYDAIKAKLITNRQYKLISPNTVANSTNKKLFPVYEGSSLQYNQLYIDSIVQTLIKNNIFKLLKECTNN